MRKLRGCGHLVTHLVSEADKGIYDAWNKGLALAQGVYVCFLGGDDRWATHQSLSQLVQECRHEPDIVCCQVMVIDKNCKFVRSFGTEWSWKKLLKAPVVAHPGLLARRSLFGLVGNFNQDFSIAGDYEWMLRLGASIRPKYVSEQLVVMRDGGISSSKISRVLSESLRARLIHSNKNTILMLYYSVRYAIVVIMSKLVALIF